MAEVQAGTDLRLQRPVAVKLLLPEMAARDDIRRRFEAEACAAASFNDPHAVAVYDTGEHEGTPYIVMERLPGETLADRIAAGPQDPDWVRRVASEVLGALGAAHGVGLVHRDVKPGNILITTDDHAKITDFGIAKSLERTDGSLELTGTGQLLGTPSYLPPERLDGGSATAKSDLYSMGVVLYEALTGRCPFRGETAVATAAAIVAGEYERLDEARPDLDRALVDTVNRAMSSDPGLRFDSAAAMAAALAPTPAAGATTLVDAAPRSDVTSVLDLGDLTQTHAVVAPAAAPAAVAAAGPARRRSGMRLPLALLIGLVFVALLVAGLNRRDAGTTNRPTSVQTESTAVSPTTNRSQTTIATVPPQSGITTPAGGTAGGKGKGKAKGKD